MRTLLLVAALLGLVALTAPTAAQPADDPVPKILEAWKKRQTAFKTVKYVVTGKVEHLYLSPLRKGMENIIKLPKVPFELPYKAVVVLDCEQKRYRVTTELRTWSTDQQVFLPRSTTISFDGEQLFVSAMTDDEFLKKGMSDLTVVKGDLTTYQIGAELWPVFAAHGLVPTSHRPLLPDRWPATHQAGAFVGRGQTAQDGVRCEVLRSEPLDVVPATSDEILVDAGTDGFVRRHVYFAGVNPFARIDARPQVKDGATLPKEWTCTWSEGKKTKTVHRLRVESFEGSVTGTDFRQTAPPGGTVEEHTIPLPGSGLDPINHPVKKFTVGPGGGRTLIEERPQLQLDGTPAPSPSPGLWLWIGLGLVSCIVAVGFAIRRRRKLS